MTPIELWNSGVRLARYMARKKARRITGADLQDFEQAALLGLWKAANKYDNRVGVQFSTYAWHHIRGELNCESWRQNIFGFKAGKAITYKKTKPTKRIPIKEEIHPLYYLDESIDTVDALESIINKLRSRNLRDVAWMYWAYGEKTDAIAEKLSLSKSRIEQLHREAYAEMKLIVDKSNTSMIIKEAA